MQKIKNNSRRDFFKKISVAAVSLSTFSFLGFKISENAYNPNCKRISEEEANALIKENKLPISNKQKPMPAPVGKQQIS
ncbi:MAG: hypothetical protein V1783_08950 [Bacteroidota bacterium]